MESSFSITVEEYIKKNEGLKLHAYTDKLGHRSVGYGRKVHPDSTLSITEEIANKWLKEDINSCRIKINKHYPWVIRRTKESQMVVLDLCYNVGFNGLSRFKWFLKALYLEMYIGAAIEILDSRYARQLPNRALRNFDMLTIGEASWKLIIK